jgi:hypothetical protein
MTIPTLRLPSRAILAEAYERETRHSSVVIRAASGGLNELP